MSEGEPSDLSTMAETEQKRGRAICLRDKITEGSDGKTQPARRRELSQKNKFEKFQRRSGS